MKRALHFISPSVWSTLVVGRTTVVVSLAAHSLRMDEAEEEEREEILILKVSRIFQFAARYVS